MRNDKRLFRCDAAARARVIDAARDLLARQPDVAFAYVHGSILTPLPFRDLDLAVYWDLQDPRRIRARTMDALEALEAALGKAAGADPAPPVDLLALNDAPLGFRYQVLRRGRLLLCRHEPQRIRWTVQTVSRYLDLKPLRERALKEAMTA